MVRSTSKLSFPRRLRRLAFEDGPLRHSLAGPRASGRHGLVFARQENATAAEVTVADVGNGAEKEPAEAPAEAPAPQAPAAEAPAAEAPAAEAAAAEAPVAAAAEVPAQAAQVAEVAVEKDAAETEPGDKEDVVEVVDDEARCLGLSTRIGNCRGR